MSIRSPAKINTSKISKKNEGEVLLNDSMNKIDVNNTSIQQHNPYINEQVITLESFQGNHNTQPHLPLESPTSQFNLQNYLDSQEDEDVDFISYILEGQRNIKQPNNKQDHQIGLKQKVKGRDNQVLSEQRNNSDQIDVQIQNSKGFIAKKQPQLIQNLKRLKQKQKQQQQQQGQLCENNYSPNHIQCSSLSVQTNLLQAHPQNNIKQQENNYQYNFRIHKKTLSLSENNDKQLLQNKNSTLLELFHSNYNASLQNKLVQNKQENEKISIDFNQNNIYLKENQNGNNQFQDNLIQTDQPQSNQIHQKQERKEQSIKPIEATRSQKSSHPTINSEKLKCYSNNEALFSPYSLNQNQFQLWNCRRHSLEDGQVNSHHIDLKQPSISKLNTPTNSISPNLAEDFQKKINRSQSFNFKQLINIGQNISIRNANSSIKIIPQNLSLLQGSLTSLKGIIKKNCTLKGINSNICSTKAQEEQIRNYFNKADSNAYLLASLAKGVIQPPPAIVQSDSMFIPKVMTRNASFLKKGVNKSDHIMIFHSNSKGVLEKKDIKNCTNQDNIVKDNAQNTIQNIFKTNTDVLQFNPQPTHSNLNNQHQQISQKYINNTYHQNQYLLYQNKFLGQKQHQFLMNSFKQTPQERGIFLRERSTINHYENSYQNGDKLNLKQSSNLSISDKQEQKKEVEQKQQSQIGELQQKDTHMKRIPVCSFKKQNMNIQHTNLDKLKADLNYNNKYQSNQNKKYVEQRSSQIEETLLQIEENKFKLEECSKNEFTNLQKYYDEKYQQNILSSNSNIISKKYNNNNNNYKQNNMKNISGQHNISKQENEEIQSSQNHTFKIKGYIGNEESGEVCLNFN